MKLRTNTVVILLILALTWRLVTWWSIADLGDEYSGIRILGFMGLSILIIGFVTYYSTKSQLSFVFFLYCTAMTFHWGWYPVLSYEIYSTIIGALYSFLSIFLGSTILHFGILYPKSKDVSRGKLMAIYSPGILGVISLIAAFFDKRALELFIGFEPLIVSIFALIGAILLFRTFFKTPPEKRSLIGADIVCIGILLANFPYIFSEFIPAMNFGEGFGFLFYRLLFIIQPIAFAIAVRRIERLQQVG